MFGLRNNISEVAFLYHVKNMNSLILIPINHPLILMFYVASYILLCEINELGTNCDGLYKSVKSVRNTYLRW